MPVHFGGLACDMARILAIAKRHRLKVIEDCAHAHGSRWEGHGLGSIGDVGCFSFFPTKIMTTGEGGMVVTSRDDLAETLRSLQVRRRRPGVRLRKLLDPRQE